jgi:flagellar hook assembly protein FlgD
LPAIATSDCVVTIEAYDALGNIGTWEGAVTTSSVSAQVELVPGTRAFATPAQFKPRSADNATIVYTLTRSADIDLQIYGADGRVVWGRRYSSGATGGRVGYNEVTWDGRDTSGGNVGNGVYAFRIISGGRVLGTGYIIVLE